MDADKNTFWVRAAVLILLAGLGYAIVIAYGRYGETVAAAEQEDPTVPLGGPGSPTREQVTKLHDALRKQLGVNGRGLSRVAHVDYDGWPDRLVVVYALDHVPAGLTAAQAVEQPPMLDVLRAVHGGGLRWRWVLLSGTAPVDAGDGQVAESTVVRATFAREKLDRVDWAKVTAAEAAGLAERITVETESATGPELKSRK